MKNNLSKQKKKEEESNLLIQHFGALLDASVSGTTVSEHPGKVHMKVREESRAEKQEEEDKLICTVYF